jgi:hypothetical protein
MPAPQPKPRTEFNLGAFMLDIDEVGPISETLLGFQASDFEFFWYYAWFPQMQVHAADWSLLHHKKIRRRVISGRKGLDDTPDTFHTEPDPVRLDQLAPADNRTLISVTAQRKDRFRIQFDIHYNNDNDQRHFQIWYPGVAPHHFRNKIFAGKLIAAGDTDMSVSFLFS